MRASGESTDALAFDGDFSGRRLSPSSAALSGGMVAWCRFSRAPAQERRIRRIRVGRGHETNQLEPREASVATRVPDSEPERDRRLVDAVGALFDQVMDRLLLSPERVTSSAEGKRLMAGDDDTEVLADTIQRVAVVATPIVRTLAHGARWLPRVPGSSSPPRPPPS